VTASDSPKRSTLGFAGTMTPERVQSVSEAPARWNRSTRPVKAPPSEDARPEKATSAWPMGRFHVASPAPSTSDFAAPYSEDAGLLMMLPFASVDSGNASTLPL